MTINMSSSLQIRRLKRNYYHYYYCYLFRSAKDYIESPLTGRKILPRESPNVDRLHETDKPSVHIRANEVEYFFASDASAIIEHTRKVIYLEDGDLAYVKDGHLEIENANTADNNLVFHPTKREVHTLQMELAQIMKGK